MSGKPAARMGDATMTGGPIVQGSTGVLIGSPNGVACASCPGGIAVGNPVNPMLGAKVLSNEVDINLPGAMSFVLSRSYNSYQTGTPSPVGLFGPGWQGGFDASLLITDEELIVNDSGGRSLHFNKLDEGEASFSRSENLWLIRGGNDKFPEGHPLEKLWQSLPHRLKMNPHFYFVASDALGPIWRLGYSESDMLQINDVLPQPLSPRRQLQSIVDRFGRQLQFKRDSEGQFAGKITAVIDGVGRYYRLELIQLPKENLPIHATGWGKDRGIRLSAVSLIRDPLYSDLPRHPLVRYDYTLQGELKAVYDKSGREIRTFSYHPDLVGRLMSHQYIGRPATTYAYDVKGRVIEQHNPGGLSYQFIYHQHHTQVIDSLGRKDTYYFEGEKGLKRLVKHERPDGSTIENTYDGSGRLIATVDPLGLKTEFDLDIATGHMLGLISPDEKTTRFSYNAQGQIEQAILPDGSRKKTTYDDLGRIIAQTDRLGQTSRYLYENDQSDSVAETEDALGAKRTLRYTPVGLVAQTTDCSGKITQYEYNRDGQITRIILEEGLSKTNTYDKQGRLVEEENNAGEKTQYRYNEAGDLLQIIQPGNALITLQYNAWGKLIEKQQNGICQYFVYDIAGRLQTLINENGAKTAFSYDVMDRLVQEIGFDGRTKRYQYNAAGALIQSQDEDLVTQLHYDISGRLTRRTLPSLKGDALTEQWQYNKNGYLTQVIHPTETHQIYVLFERDKVGRITQETQQIIDANGQTCWQHNIAHGYQAQGLRTETTPDGLTPLNWLTYGSGHLLGLAMNGQSLLEYERDNLHRETALRFGQNSQIRSYDKIGRLANLDFSTLTGAQMNRTYRYDELGQLAEQTLNGHFYLYQYDNFGRLRHADTAHYTKQYDYDPAGNRVTHPAHFQSLSAPEQHWPTNRIEQDSQYTYRYDRYGNLTEKISLTNQQEKHTYHYDALHRLVTYERTEQGQLTTKAHYRYDAFNRRLEKQVTTQCHTQTYHYGWDGDNLVLTEKDTQRIYTIYHPGSFVPLLRIEGAAPQITEPLGQKLAQQIGFALPDDITMQLNEIEKSLKTNTLTEAQKAWLTQINLSEEHLKRLMDVETPATASAETKQIIQYYYCDHLGTPQALVDEHGNLVWQGEFDPYGNPVTIQNPEQLYQPIRMQGQHYDEESGLHYNRHRYYDPTQGKYITQDPIGLMGGLNTYIYPNNPLAFIDPKGLSSYGACVMGTAAAGAAGGGAIGATGGGIAGAAAGAVGAGGGCTLVAPGVGTVGCGAAGAVAGGKAGAAAGGLFGMGVGGLGGLIYGAFSCATSETDETDEIDCAAARAHCTETCEKAECDEDYQGRFSGCGGVWGGSWDSCMKGCLPVECGGNGV